MVAAVRSRRCVSATARPATRPTGSTPTCSPTAAHRRAPLAIADPDSPATVGLRSHCACPQGPGRDPCRARQPAPRPPADRVSRRGRAVRRHRQPDLAARSSSGSPPPTGPPGCRRSGSAPGCAPTATAAARPPPSSTTRLRDAPAGLTGDDGDARGTVTLAYVAMLESPAGPDRRARHAPRRTPRRPPRRRTSSPACPAAATIRAATLLAEIGDCRARFPDAEALACRAGVAPSTRASGTTPHVAFRIRQRQETARSTDDFAGDSRPGQPLGRRPLPPRPRQRQDATPTPNASSPAAWAHIIWRCWQDNTAYDPARHGGLHQRLTAQA